MSNVSIEKLERGMIIDSDIFSKRGSLLLYKGFKIENPDLVSIVLKRNGIYSVVIKDDEVNPEIAVKESERISQKIKKEVTEFKEEFTKIVENLEEDIEQFRLSKDISNIRNLDNNVDFAKEANDSILTVFQLVEKIKNDGEDEYNDIIQMSLISYSIGKWLDLEEEELKELSQTALLSGVFTISDINEDNKHELKGIDLVSSNVLDAAFASRERIDGSGPMGLEDEQIPLYSKIISIAEVFCTLTTHSQFYEKISVFDALKVMQTEYIGLLDTRILYIFLHRVANKYIGSTVRLSDGTSGIIVFVPENEIVLPYIKTGDGQVVNLQQQKNNKIIEIL